MRTLTYTITHSSVFVRSLGQQVPHAESAQLRHELLYGTAAQDAFVALFDKIDEFNDLARDATQAPLAREAPRRQRPERSPSTRTARAQSRNRDSATERGVTAPFAAGEMRESH